MGERTGRDVPAGHTDIGSGDIWIGSSRVSRRVRLGQSLREGGSSELPELHIDVASLGMYCIYHLEKVNPITFLSFRYRNRQK